MLKEFQYIYNGARLTRVTGSTESIGRIEAIAGTIKTIAVRAENVGSVGNFVFNVRRNGTALLSGGNKLTVNTGAKRAEKASADFGTIMTVKGDLLSFAMDEVGAGGILGDLIFTITIDDGIEAETEIAADIHAAAAKTAPVNADEFALVDSAASSVLKKLSWQNVKATLKTYFDTLYQAALVSGTNIKTINTQSLLGSGDITISGGGASALDDLTDVALSSPTNGQVLKFNGTNWVNGTDNNSGGGGGSGSAIYGSIYPMDNPPSSPATENDEFDDAAATGSNWTITTGGTGASYTINDEKSPSRLMVDWGASNGGIELKRAFVPGSADFSFTMKIEAANAQNYQGLFFQVADGTATDQVGFGDYYNAGQQTFQVREFNPFGVAGGINLSIPYAGFPIIAHFQRVSGTYKLYYSFNGIHFVYVASSSKSFTVSQIILAVAQAGATTANRVAVDWIRRDYLFLS